MKLSIIGLGKLGSPMAAVFAKKGFDIIGVDINGEFVKKLQQGIAPVNEPHLQEYIEQYKSKIEATQDFRYAVLNTEITFIIVPTPSDQDGVFTNKFVLNAIDEVARAVAEKKSRHIIVITSTVMPGSTGGEIKERLESVSGKVVGKDIGLCYNPEFIALGSVIHDMLNPDFILIGESDKESGDLLEKVYKETCGENTKFRRMNWVNAEITKISVNTFVTTKISYANMISDLCDKIPEADAAVVCNAIGTDSRIGNKYLGVGLGYGGPCFPRDNLAFAVLADKLGAHPLLAKATDQINHLQPKRVADLVRKLNVSNVAILGLSYKAESEVVEQSQGIMIANELIKQGCNVKAYDPSTKGQTYKTLSDKVTLEKNAQKAVDGADVVIVATSWPEIIDFLNDQFANLKDKYIVDCWRSLAKDGDNILYLGSK